MNDTGTEYIDTQMEKYITESGRKVKMMATGTKKMMRGQNIADSGSLISNGEREY